MSDGMLLEVKGLHAYYGQIEALRGVDFELLEGGVVAILGANGAGKTTTLRSICGMTRVRGSIKYGGEEIAGTPTSSIARKRVAHVPEGRGTFTRLTTEENLFLGAYSRRDKRAVQGDMELVYGYFPRLKERRKQQAGSMSGGEQQMLAVGRALMGKPRLMLLDEPSFGLAPMLVEELFEILGKINENEKVGILLVEQNATLALALATRAYLLETGEVVLSGASGDIAADEGVRKAYLGYLGGAMEFFLVQTLSGLATGAIYASVALAVVMIYTAIDHLNFAQGEMAVFSTYIAWQLTQWGVPFWGALALCVMISFIGGVLIERCVFGPISKDAPVLAHVVVFIALFSLFNALSGFIWDFTLKTMPTPFGSAPIGGLVSAHQIAMILITLVMLGLIYAFFRYTPLGLAMRAASSQPESARLVGIRVKWMLALGWGLAAALGAVAGILVAPVVFLEPNMMLGILLYGFAGAVLGGLNSPGGAVLGGFLVGVLENLAGAYVIDSSLKLTFALAVIVAVLVFRPAGLLGRSVVSRV